MQLEILTGLKAYYDDDKGLCVNPFYGASKSDLIDNFEHVKIIYPKLWHHFVGGYVLNCIGNVDFKDIPTPKSLEELDVCLAKIKNRSNVALNKANTMLKNGDIDPLPESWSKINLEDL